MDKQPYVVLVQLGGAGDKEMWRPGSIVELDEATAALHLRAGNVASIEVTVVPEEKPNVAIPEVIHEPVKTANKETDKAVDIEADKKVTKAKDK